MPSPKHIFTHEEHAHVHLTFRKDGVWHPDKLHTVLAWSGSGCAAADTTHSALPGTFINPFTPTPELAKVHSFTEQLPPSVSGLQWAMPTPNSIACIPADRGNWGLARQDSKPRWMTKPAFLDFCRLVAAVLCTHYKAQEEG